jgi:Mor family transcriptional regulator
MVLDHEVCRVPGCTVHTGKAKAVFKFTRDEQILEDWASGEWLVEELGSFWRLDSRTIEGIIRKAVHKRELARSA